MDTLQRRARAAGTRQVARRRTRSVPGRGRPHGRYAGRKAEYFYDYAGQDPINSYDLNGTFILSHAAEGLMLGPIGAGVEAGEKRGPKTNGAFLPTADDLATAGRAIGHEAGVGIGALKSAAVAAAPYFVACIKGGAIGAIGGPEGAAFGCASDAFAHYADASNNTTLKRVAVGFQLAAAVETGGSVRLAQRNPERPFQLWREFIARLGR